MNYLNLEEFEKKIAYTFQDKSLLKLALTHSSYANENKSNMEYDSQPEEGVTEYNKIDNPYENIDFIFIVG